MIASLPTGPGNLESAAFFEAAREGRFLLRRSITTGKPHWYPRARCPFDGSETEWFEASGEATIYSYSAVPSAEAYVVAYIRLREGPVMLTNIVDCDPAALAIDQPVRLVWRPAGDSLVPCFTPAD